VSDISKKRAPASVHAGRPETAYDLIVVGSGIAGLYAALLASSRCKVLLVTKSRLEESNTRYAQGGIAAALDDRDSPELHLRDTIAAGDGLCDLEPLTVLTRDAPRCIDDLLRLGVPFDREGAHLARTLEAAHSLPRVLHAGGDATGSSIEKILASAVLASSAKVLENFFCTSLLVERGQVRGVNLLCPDGQTTVVSSSNVLLASGGAGRLFARTTNPPVATGDGMAMAFEAGAELMDVEFMQFHPTALALDAAPSFLISEAVRGEGGVLRNVSGHQFMGDYHQDRELAPRDVVARAIHSEMLSSGSSSVWLDVTHLPKQLLEQRFPTILKFCRKYDLEPTSNPIPVSPAAHYMMGGVLSDSWGRTTVSGLLACGEVACTGVHGANRLASNSLLEGLVFARRIVRLITSGDPHRGLPFPMEARPLNGTVDALRRSSTVPQQQGHLRRKELAEEMWREAGLVRSKAGLSKLLEAIDKHAKECSSEEGWSNMTSDDYEAANLLRLSQLLAQSALLREESRGAHFRSDFPHRSSSWQGHISVSTRGAHLLGTQTFQSSEISAGDRREESASVS
jgi:L-aspartate oxidase